MDRLSLSYAFGLGMVALFNPCGFAMLPAYIGFFLAGDEDVASPPPHVRVFRALTIGVLVTAGFMAVFLLAGLAIQLVAGGLVAQLPWVSIGLGIGMVALGVRALRGRSLRLALPFRPSAPTDRRSRSMFFFGVSYALISCACTIPLFLATVMTGLTSGNVVVGSLHFVAYAAGMGVILIVLTLGLSLAQHSMVMRMRRVLPYVDRASAVMLIVAGVYVSYYGWYTLRVYGGDLTAGGPAAYVYNASSLASAWIQELGPGRIGLVLGAVIAAALIVALGYRVTTASRPGPAASPVDTQDVAPASELETSRPAKM